MYAVYARCSSSIKRKEKRALFLKRERDGIWRENVCLRPGLLKLSLAALVIRLSDFARADRGGEAIKRNANANGAVTISPRCIRQRALDAPRCTGSHRGILRAIQLAFFLHIAQKIEIVELENLSAYIRNRQQRV